MPDKSKKTKEAVVGAIGTKEPIPVSTKSVKVEAVETPILRVLSIENRLSQVLAVNVFDQNKKEHHVQIPPKGRVPWVDVPMGPDVDAKVKKGFIFIRKK